MSFTWLKNHTHFFLKSHSTHWIPTSSPGKLFKCFMTNIMPLGVNPIWNMKQVGGFPFITSLIPKPPLIKLVLRLCSMSCKP
jgi:hypothetical protein